MRIAATTRRRWARGAALLLVPLIIAVQLQRGAAEARHNWDAPLTIEAPLQLLPCDLALWAYPATVNAPLDESLAALLSASGVHLAVLGLAHERLARRLEASLDTPRGPPLR